jgi:hypothetical protein
MDPDLFITIVFCSLVFGLAAGAGAVFVRTEPEHLDRATPVVRRRENPSLTEQGGGAQWHP